MKFQLKIVKETRIPQNFRACGAYFRVMTKIMLILDGPPRSAENVGVFLPLNMPKSSKFVREKKRQVLTTTRPRTQLSKSESENNKTPEKKSAARTLRGGLLLIPW